VLLRFSKSRKRTVSDGFVKKPLTRTRFWIPNEGIINLYTPAVEHSACPLVGGKCGDNAYLRQLFLAGHAVRPQQCRGHNHLGRSPERPGHIGQPAAIGRRRALQHCTVWSVPRPLNNVLPPLTLDVKHSLQPYARNAMHITSDRRHSLNLSGDMASATRTHADVQQCVHPSQCKPPDTDAGRCTMPKPRATHRNPLRRRPNDRHLYRFR